jgi:hypothetical protein
MCDSMCWEEQSQRTQKKAEGDEGHPPCETITIRLKGLARAAELARQRMIKREG